MTKKDSLPAHRMGRHWKSKVSEVGKWVLQGGAGPGEETESTDGHGPGTRVG